MKHHPIIHVIDLKFNKLTPNFRRFDAVTGSIEERVFLLDNTLWLVNKIDSLWCLQLGDTPEFNFKEQRISFKDLKEVKGQLETKVDKLRLFKMV